jgi:hypothetical protein
MPFKHQSECYRTVNGVRWPNFCDVMSDEDEQEIAKAKSLGARFKMRKHPDGYRQAFIDPDGLATYVAAYSTVPAGGGDAG